MKVWKSGRGYVSFQTHALTFLADVGVVLSSSGSQITEFKLRLNRGGEAGTFYEAVTPSTKNITGLPQGVARNTHVTNLNNKLHWVNTNISDAILKLITINITTTNNVRSYAYASTTNHSGILDTFDSVVAIASAPSPAPVQTSKIRIGSATIDKVYVGNKQISKAYVGDTQIL